MRKLLPGLLVSLISCAHAFGAAPADPWLDDFTAAKEQAAKKRQFLVAYFFHNESAPVLCERLESETLKTREVSSALRDFIRVRVDATKLKTPGWQQARDLKVRIFPTVIFFDPQGRELDRFSGFTDVSTFLRRTVEAISPKSNYVMLKERLKKNPRDIDALYAMGLKYARRNEFDQAQKYFEQVAEFDKENKHQFADNLLLREVERLQRNLEFPKALETVKTFEKEHPDSDEKDYAMFMRARLLWLTEKTDESLKVYEEFMRKYPASDYRPQALVALSALKEATSQPTSAPSE